MRCPRCDANLSDRAKRCNFCGQDLSILQYARRISNSYYNMGLEKAQVRDLSGAVEVLKKSLQFDKKNSNARNLLGLVYYEMGEMVAALSEWVLSKYLQPEDNLADYFMTTVQKNQTELDATNQTIKKYNAALAAVKGGNEDLAIIQLKKVVSLNPHFVRAQQLLALLYISQKEYARAAKCLNRARRIDANNTTTLRYLKEIGDKAAERRPQPKKTPKKDPLANVMPVGTYQEEKKTLMPVIQVMIGIIVGIAVCFFLIRPTLMKSGSDGSLISDSNEQASVQSAQISTLERERDALKKEMASLRKKTKTTTTEAQNKVDSYEKLLKGISLYLADNKTQAAVAVAGCKKTDFDSQEAKDLYTTVGSISTREVKALVEQGKTEMNSSYDQAISTFKDVLALNADNQDAMAYMGRCYHLQNKKKQAVSWYKKAIAVDDTTATATQAETWMQQIDKSSTSTGDETTE